MSRFPYSSPKKILLIEPPFYRLFNYERWHYPVTLTLIGTFLKNRGHEVSIYDADRPSALCRSLSRLEVTNNYPLYKDALKNEGHPIWLEVEETIKKIKPEVIGITSITAKIDSANRVARIARKILGDSVRIVLGGPHVQGMQRMDPLYDFGPEYDEVITQIPNLIDQTPDKDLILDLDKYSPRNLSSILTSSGCPNICTFCCHSFDRKYVYRDLESIRKELLEIKNRFHSTEPIYVMDDCFFFNEKRFNEISALLQELGQTFTAGAGIAVLTPKKVEQFVARGGQRIYVGVESGSQRVLDRVKKRLRLEQVREKTRMLNDLGLAWSAFVIVGFPFETLEELKLTETFLYEIKPKFISINRFTPYPGTEIYREFYKDSHLQFVDLYQLNRSVGIQLSDESENYIEKMFNEFDDYNRINKEKELKRA